MDFNCNTSLKEHGFTGFISVQELWNDKSNIPKKMGIYFVINPEYKTPQFIYPGVGGFHKGKDPNVPIEELEINATPNSQIVYIGKAGGNSNKATLHSRLGQYLRFGQTKTVGHAGGRYIWQLKNHTDLLFFWKETPEIEPATLESELIKQHLNTYGKWPLANLKG